MSLPFSITFEPPTRADARALLRARWPLAAVGAATLIALAAAILNAQQPVRPAATARLQMASTPPGAAVEVDDEVLGRTPLQAAVEPGDHRVRLRRNGYADASYQVRVADGETRTLGADLWLRRPAVQRLRPTFPGATVVDAGFLADGAVWLAVALPPASERQLWLLDSRGGTRRLGPPGSTPALAIAPDGLRLAYLARGADARSGGTGRVDQLWLAERDGDAGRRRYALPPGDAQLVDLAWAPDARHLLLVVRERLAGGGHRSHLLWLDAAAGAPRPLASLPAAVVPGSYAWSPGGDRVAFLTLAGQLTSLCVLGADGDFRYLADLSRDDGAPLNVPPLAWSSDGRRVVYAAPVQEHLSPTGWLWGPRATVGLFAADLAAPAAERLGTASGQSPTWRPDGALVALARPRGGGPLALRAFDPAGQGQDVADLGVQAPALYAARWDAARGQAILATRAAASFGAGRAEYWLVRFVAEPAR